jgi:hypothetical protein
MTKLHPNHSHQVTTDLLSKSPASASSEPRARKPFQPNSKLFPSEPATKEKIMKTILIEDWYAPEFRVRINDPQNCPKLASRRRPSYTPAFRAIQCEPRFTPSRRQFRRIAQFAHALAHHAF